MRSQKGGIKIPLDKDSYLIKDEYDIISWSLYRYDRYVRILDKYESFFINKTLEYCKNK